MHKKLFALILAFILLSSLALPGSAAVPDGLLASDASLPLSEEKAYCNATLEDDFADDRVVVVLSNKASTSLRTYTTADFEGIGCTKVQNLTQHTTELVNAKLRGETAELQKTAEPDVITFAEFSEVDTEKFHQILCLTLDKAGKQNVLDTIDILMKHPDVISAEPDYVIKAASTPNDTYYADQWAITKINLPAAWNYTTGSSTVRVGVIDHGIASNHPDLSGKVNVSLSKDFTTGATSVAVDTHGHGTQVAGIIGATVNNGKGISGVCHNVQLISLRVFNDYHNGDISWYYQAIDYARSQNIPILNMSIVWSSTRYTNSQNSAFYSSLTNYGGLVICAAGNANNSTYGAVDIDETPIYPGAFDHPRLIVVGASKRDDTKLVETNWGAESVDLFAPGDDIYTCHPQGVSTGDATYVSNGYVHADGSSVAAPYVTGVAALILAKHPSLSATQIRDKILWSVDYVIGLNGLCATSGRLNAYKALHPHSFHHYNYTVTHHISVCACGATYLKGAHNYEQVGPRLYRCVCGYESDYLP